MVSFEIFVKAMPPSLSELKVLPSFCFAFKIPDDVAVTINYPVVYGNPQVHTTPLLNSRLTRQSLFTGPPGGQLPH